MCQYRHSSFNKWYIWEWGQNSWRVPWNIISGGKTALVLGSPSADLRDDQRVFMKVRLRWSLLQRACAIRGVVCSALHCSVFCVLCVLLHTAQLRPQLGCTRVRATETCRRSFNSLHVISCVGSVSAFLKKMLGQLASSKVESDWSAQGGAGSCRLGRRSGVAVKHRWEKCILVWLKQ